MSNSISANSIDTMVSCIVQAVSNSNPTKMPWLLWNSFDYGTMRKVAQKVEEATSRRVRLINMFDSSLDLHGMPYYDNGNISFYEPKDMPFDENSNDIVLFDGIDNAPYVVKHVAFQLLVTGSAGGYTVPKNVNVVALANKESKGTEIIPFPALNKMVHYTIA